VYKPVPITIRSDRSASGADFKAYADYQRWCRYMGMTPGPIETYLRETKSIEHAPINWSGAR
jgi:hypothetical protein